MLLCPVTRPVDTYFLLLFTRFLSRDMCTIVLVISGCWYVRVVCSWIEERTATAVSSLFSSRLATHPGIPSHYHKHPEGEPYILQYIYIMYKVCNLCKIAWANPPASIETSLSFLLHWADTGSVLLPLRVGILCAWWVAKARSSTECCSSTVVQYYPQYRPMISRNIFTTLMTNKNEIRGHKVSSSASS